MQQKHLNLYKIEIVVYFATYVIYIVYGLWMLINARHKIWNISNYKFPKGWPILNSSKDDTNDELYAFTEYMRVYWPWYIFHLGVTSVVRKYNIKWQSLSNAIVCLLIIFMTMQLKSIALIGCLIIPYYFVAQRQSKILTWLMAVMWMIAMIYLKSNRYLQESLGYVEFHNVIVTLCWSILRCCSYSLQYNKSSRMCEADTRSKYTLSNYLGYTLYFPCLMLGPFMGYNRYIILEKGKSQLNFENCKIFIYQIAKVLFWWVVLEIATHFVYVHYMSVDIRAVEVLDTKFGLYAVGYFMGQFFFVFYVISYGLGIAFAQFDGLHPPRAPRCIGVIHYYSDMWKYFDEGLYEFLFSHIYAEMCTKVSSVPRKILAMAFTFLFVFLWHGYYGYVFIWSVLNFCCLLAEKVLKSLIKSPSYTNIMQKYFKMNDANLKRFNVFLGSQIFIPAAFTNCYFISGLDVGNYLMSGVYQGGWFNYVTLTYCVYCYSQCCEILLKKNYVN